MPMRKGLLCTVAFVLVACLGVASAGDKAKKGDTGGDKKAADWKTDWGAFIDELAPYLKRNAPIADVKQKFEGQPVTWVGTLQAVTLKPEMIVQMKMPAKKVTLSNGVTSEVEYLALV